MERTHADQTRERVRSRVAPPANPSDDSAAARRIVRVLIFGHALAMMKPLLRFGPALLALQIAFASFSHAAKFDLSTATVADVNAAFDSGALSAEKLTALYLKRIQAYNDSGPKIHAVIFLNAKALEEARALDAERKAKGPRSPLHGIPVLLKDNYDTK